MNVNNFTKSQGLDIHANEFTPSEFTKFTASEFTKFTPKEPIVFDESVILNNLEIGYEIFNEFENEFVESNKWLFDFCPFSGFSISDKQLNLV
jgi:hypothetical protein